MNFSSLTKFKIVFSLFFSLILFPIFSEQFFWGNPEVISETNEETAFPLSISSNQINNDALLFYQKIENSNIFLACKSSPNGNDWGKEMIFAGPFSFSGEVPHIYSVAQDENGQILVCATDNGKIKTFLSKDNAKSFLEFDLENEIPFIAPRVFSKTGGGFILFATESDSESFFLNYTLLDDFSSPHSFSKFDFSMEDAQNPFAPTFVSLKESDILVFQAQHIQESRLVFQLYASTSYDGGKTWSPSEMLTHSDSSNQNPALLYDGKQVILCWERSLLTSSATEIFCAILDKSAHFVESEQKISTGGKNLSFVWQKNVEKNEQTVCTSRDTKTESPSLEPTDFAFFTPQNKKNLTLKINAAEDTSSVRGFSILLSKNPDDEAENFLTNLLSEDIVNFSLDSDGSWYITVKQQDYAENWSEAARYAYILDTVPPQKPIVSFPLDAENENIFSSNTFSLFWDSDSSIENDDTDSWLYDFKKLSDIPKNLTRNSFHSMSAKKSEISEIVLNLVENGNELFEKIETKYKKSPLDKKTISVKNAENGVYVFSVASCDKAGNVSDFETKIFILNSYEPKTLITELSANTDSFGDTTFSIQGDEFLYEGEIVRIAFDKDAKKPYDYELFLSEGDFENSSSKLIQTKKPLHLERGNYYVIVEHSLRGETQSYKTLFSVLQNGTVKVISKDKNLTFWENAIHSDFLFFQDTAQQFLILAIFLLSSIAILIAIKHTTGDAIFMQKTKKITRGKNVLEKKAKVKVKGISLRIKLILVITLLLLVISSSVIFVFGMIMLKREKSARLESLKEKSIIILDALAEGAKVNLPNAQNNLLAFSDLIEESKSFSDAKYAIITGSAADKSQDDISYIWASTDSDILGKIDTEVLSFGKSKFVDFRAKEIEDRCKTLEIKAQESVRDIEENRSELLQRGMLLASKTSAEDIQERAQIAESLRQLQSREQNILDSIAKEGVSSIPEFSESPNILSETYLFYRPVLYVRGAQQTIVNGIVFLEVSTKSTQDQLLNTTRTIFSIALSTILFSLLVGFLTSIIISSIIVRPINRLAKHVEMIRDTEDKEKLHGKNIKIRSRDEIGFLGDTINQMTFALSEAAIQEKNLMFGKKIQARFLPLDSDDSGATLVTGHYETEAVEFSCYYEGADELSGDYFDYHKIDETHYAVIKCDVSGHGVPASLIMVEVASIFQHSFQDWKMENPNQGTNINFVVENINDLLEQRGFNGRFAAFTLALFDSQNGNCWICNAGDSILNVFDGKKMKKQTLPLPETPAAGMFSTELVKLQGGYPIVHHTLKKGDVLFMYTDGLEESESLGERFGTERIDSIIECVFSGGTYTLERNDGYTFTFDFSNSNRSAKDAIMALVSIEKIFRLVPLLDSDETNHVKVDRSIDDFLQLHFKEYGVYCIEKNISETEHTNLWWNKVREEPQSDDLTLFAIRKK